jgi:hypothetical protein
LDHAPTRDRRNTPQSARRIKRVCVIVCCSLPDETIDRKKEEEKEMKPLKKKYIFPPSFHLLSIGCHRKKINAQ